MAHIWEDRVLETSTTTGTGNFTLAGAITGYRAFSAVCSTSDTVYYSIVAVDANGIPTGEWETGLGTYSAANTLTRTTVLESSNAGAAVNFSAGTKRVGLTTVAALAATLLQGKHTIAIMAGAMMSRSTSGAAAGTTETTTNKIMYRTWDFDQSTDEFAQFSIPAPKSWNEGTVTAEFIWSSGVTGDVVWGIQGVAISNDDVLDAAFGTAVTVTDSVTATTDLMTTAETSAITIAGTPAEKDFLVFQVYRDADNGSDTAAGDAKLIAVRLFITYNAGNDA